MREYDEIAKDLVGYKLNWTTDNMRELNTSRLSMKEATRTAGTAERVDLPLRSSIQGVKTKKDSKEEEKEKLRFIDSYFKEARASAERKAYLHARAMAEAGKLW